MADQLRYSNSKLLTCNSKLAISCCTNAVDDVYWAAIPCEVEVPYRTTCDEVDQCQYINRYYVSQNSSCQGIQNSVCECQRLVFTNYDDMVNGPLTNAMLVSYTGPNNGSIIIDSNTITLIENNGVGPSYSYTLSSGLGILDTAIDILPNWEAAISEGEKVPAYILATGTFSLASFSFKRLASVASSFSLKYGSLTTDSITFSTNPITLASRMQTSLAAVTGLSSITVSYNSGLTNAGVNKYFEVYFGGDLCGSSKDQVSLDIYKINTTVNFNSIYDSVSGQYGKYNSYYGIYYDRWNHESFENNYLIRNSGLGNNCPYESDGISAFNSGIECCPQKGATIGPNQLIDTTTDNYVYNGSDFENLETSFVIAGKCYKLSPFYYLFGKEGRFRYDPLSAQQPYIIPDCDFEGNCEHDVPGNCIVELFLAQFHKDIPWGPFGSYYPGIENRDHLSIIQGTGYINDNYAGSPESFRGYKYAPQGSVYTRGTWTNTNTIEISFTFHRATPFYLGGDAFLDKDQFGTIDSSTVVSGLTLVQNGGCSQPIILTYDCSGKYVSDFVNAINHIKTEAYGDIPSCNVFAFCLGSQSAGFVPASKIINISNEVYDQAKTLSHLSSFYTMLESYGGGDPTNDSLSGADIFVGPLTYDRMWPSRITGFGDADDTILPQDTYSNPRKFVSTIISESIQPSIKIPPVGRHRIYSLPKQTNNYYYRNNDGTYFGIARRKTPWFTAIPGKVQNVIDIVEGSGIPSYITAINLSVATGIIRLGITSGVVEIHSTGLNTNKFGAEYTASGCAFDLNRITFTDNGTTYWPVTATGTLPYNIWFDDSTFWDSTTHEPLESGAVGAVLTPYNWSYKEDVLDLDAVNLKQTSSSISVWSRQRTDWNADGSQYTNPIYDLMQSGCKPISANTLESTSRLNCGGDQYVVNNYLVSYGCSSEICKTEWYLKTSRCSCSSEAGCYNGAHHYNQPGNSWANESAYGGYAVTQPDLYICEYTIHPECDIPMLVKVPLQIITTTPNRIFESQYCGDPTISVAYSDGQADNYTSSPPILSVTDAAYKWGCVRTDFTDQHAYTSVYDPSFYPGGFYFRTSAFCAECVAWCQYIDPSSASRVQKEDIPATWPPTSYIIERGNPSFCSDNLFDVSLDIVAGIAPPSLPNCGLWDTIIGVDPVLPPDKVDCNILGPRLGEPMRAIFRPIVNPLVLGDLRGTAEQERIDINCRSKCCGCFFRCAPNDLELNHGPYSCPCMQTTTSQYTITNHNIWAGICGVYNTNDNLIPMAGVCYNPSIIGLDGRYVVATKVNGNITNIDITYSYSKTSNVCCPCQNKDVTGQKNYNSTTSYSCSGPTPEGLGAFYTPNCTICSTSYTVLFDCNTIPEEGPGNVTSDTEIDSANCPECSNTSCCQLAIKSTLHETINGTRIDTPCGASSSNWHITRDVLYSGTMSTISPCGSDRGVFGGVDEHHTTETYVEDGEYNKTSITCGVCNEPLNTSKSLAYILSWFQNSSWICGYSNYSWTSDTNSTLYGSPYCT